MRGSDAGAAATEAYDELRGSVQNLEMHEFGELYYHSDTQFFSTCDPYDYFCALAQELTNKGIQYRISSDKLKLKYVHSEG